MLFLTYPKNSKSSRRLLLLALILWALVLPAWGQNHIVQKAWLEDPSGTLTLSEVQAQKVQPYTGVLSRGFGSETIWIRLTIDPLAHPMSSREPEKLILRIRPVYLDHIEVHDPLSPLGLVGLTGDHHHPRDHAFEGLDFMVPIARGDTVRDIWLKVRSTSTRQIAAQVVNVDNLTRMIHTQELLYALYVGVIIVFVIWSLVYWLFSRESLVGAFALSQLAALLYAACSLGYGRAFWPKGLSPIWLDMLTSVFSVLAVSAAVFFHILHIKEFSPPRWMGPLFKVLMAMAPFKLLLLSIQEPMLALNLNMMEILLAPGIFLLAVVLAKGWSRPPENQHPALRRPYVIGFYALLLAILLIAVLPGLALTSGGEIPLYIVQAHGLVTAFLILLMLQYRERVRRQQQNETLLALERTQMQARQERSIREEQEKMLAMLAHELKTPLATMQMRLNAQAQGSREIRRAIRDMDNVIERCLQTTQLSDRQLQARSSRVDLVGLVRDAVSSCSHPEQVVIEAPVSLFTATDRQLLFIALNNLLENACKYAAPQSSIQVGLSCHPSPSQDTHMIDIEVSNAPGVAGWPAADKVFEKYYRSSNARRQAGTGLGLYLVSSLMQVLGGRAQYIPDAHRVRFILSLPLKQEL